MGRWILVYLSSEKIKPTKKKKPQSTNEAWEMAIANSLQYIKCFVYSK